MANAKTRRRRTVGWWAGIQLLVLVAADSNVRALCPGDCDGDGEVIITELMQGVGVALGTRRLGACPQFDPNFDERVTVDEILTAVDIALSACRADPTIALHSTYPGSFFGDTKTHGQALALADLERDGHLDVILPDLFGQRGVSVFRGRGDGSFGIGRHFEAGHTPIAMTTGDFNGDQHVDVAVASEGTRLLTVVLGNGDGTLEPMSTYPVRLNPRALATADLNQDGTLDIVVVNRGTNDLNVFLGRGDGTFDLSDILLTGGSSPDGITITDLNHDGDPDLIVANRGSGTLSVSLGRTGPTFAPPIVYSVPPSPLSLAVGDYDEDGNPDVVLTSPGTNVLSFVAGRGDGTLDSAQKIIDLPNIHRVKSADLNGDGHLDVVAGSFINEDTVISLLGNGDGTFDLAHKFNSDGGEVFDLALGDLDQDGIPDLATESGLTLRGNGDGTFATASRLNCWARGAADVNADGHLDIVSETREGLNIHLGRGDGTFNDLTSTQEPVFSLVFGDLNGDGRADAVGIDEHQNLVLLRSQSDGLLAAGERIDAIGWPVAIADANHDGANDLFLSDSILLGVGDGMLQRAAKFVTPELFWCPSNDAALADLNADGHLDLVAAPPNTFVACVFLGNGDGTMSVGKVADIGANAEGLAIADFNEDGWPDLAVGRSTPTRFLSVLLGNADGQFGSPRQFLAGASPGSLVALDFNADSHTDIAAVTEFDAVAILLGSGDGSFRHPVFFGAGRSASRSVPGDFNEDGLPDLAIAPRFLGPTTLLLSR